MPGLIVLDAGPIVPRASNAVGRRLVAGNLPASLANRGPSQTGGRRNHRVAAVADGTRLDRRPPPATALVQHGATTAYFATRVASSSMPPATSWLMTPWAAAIRSVGPDVS